jgi:negative regulator of flagellin synthesis FlgM
MQTAGEALQYRQGSTGRLPGTSQPNRVPTTNQIDRTRARGPNEDAAGTRTFFRHFAKVSRADAVRWLENPRKDFIVKIDSSHKPLGTGTIGSSRAKAPAESARSESAGASEVKLSAASAQLASASSGAPVDGARIAEIKLAISEGRFKINAEAIADGLIDTARDLLKSQRQS